MGNLRLVCGVFAVHAMSLPGTIPLALWGLPDVKHR